jgi:hypothetical protein
MTTPMEDRYEGQYLDALDLPENAEVPVVIESVADPKSETDSSGKVIKNAILSFVGKKKRLIINTTNYRNLKSMFGREPKDWIGKTIRIQRRYLDAARGFGVNNTLCIRIIPPIGTSILKSAANYMGSATRYPEAHAKRNKAQAEPVPQPASPVSNITKELSHWLTGVAARETVETCQEFRATMLPECPEDIRGHVEEALRKREHELKEKRDVEAD